MDNTAEAQSIDAGKESSSIPIKHASAKIRNIAITAGAAASLIALYLLSQYNYVLFHCLAEVFSIVITFAIFAIAWNSRRMMDNQYLLFIGIAFLFVGGVDLVHTLAYKGMNVFPAEYGSNLATQLWIATRYLLSFSLLGALLFVRRKLRTGFVLVGYSVVVALLFSSIFYWGNFPTAFVNQAGPLYGLTPFKIVSEYAISFILLCSIGLLIKNRREFTSSVFKSVVVATALAIATEMAFTLYTDPYGIANMAGHLLNVVSFYFIYKALVETGITRPYDLLFRNLKQSETNLTKRAAELTELNNQLVQEAAERKKVEQALLLSSKEWERTFNSVPDFIAVLDSRHRILRANKPMAQQLGVQPEQCIGLNCYSCVHGTNEPPEMCPHTKTLQDGLEHIAEVHEPRLGGDFLVSTTPLRDEAGQIIGSVHVARNITEHRQMQEKLAEYSRHLEALVEEKTKQLRDSERLAVIGQTAGMVGHDIRNPLQAIASDLYLEKVEVASLPDGEAKKNLQESINCMEENLYYIEKIVSDLQDFARQLNPKKEKVNLEKTIEDVMIMVTIPENVNVVIKAEKGYPVLTADSTMVKRVIVNLVQNAVQAMPKGGNLTINVTPKGGQAFVSIEDTGEGIPEEVKQKIFTPLFTTKSKGQGFGLAVVKRLVEAQGGAITFTSKVGEGTKFTVQLPT